MVHCCIEIDLFVHRETFNINFIQFLIPQYLTIFFNFIKIPMGDFCSQVMKGSLRTNRRQGKFYFYLFTFFRFKIKIGSKLFSGHLWKVLSLIKFPPKTFINIVREILLTVLDKWLRETHRKINSTGTGPAVCLPESGYQCIILNPYKSPNVFIVIIIDSSHQI
ncbi:hypothetical protein D3C72_566480 [compost metagenome]